MNSFAPRKTNFQQVWQSPAQPSHAPNVNLWHSANRSDSKKKVPVAVDAPKTQLKNKQSQKFSQSFESF